MVDIRINCGGGEYTDADGHVWAADPGTAGGSTSTTSTAIAGTTDDALYQAQRYGADLTFTFSVANGDYTVTLKLAEPYYTNVGDRSFDVAVNGTAWLTNYDIVAHAGAAFTAQDETLPVTVTDGALVVHLTSGPRDLPTIGALAIVAAVAPPPPPGPPGLVFDQDVAGDTLIIQPFTIARCTLLDVPPGFLGPALSIGRRAYRAGYYVILSADSWRRQSVRAVYDHQELRPRTTPAGGLYLDLPPTLHVRVQLYS